MNRAIKKVFILLGTLSLLFFTQHSIMGQGKPATFQPPSDEEVEKLGRVSFPLTCNPKAQKQFKRALSMLHSFWYSEARKVFTAVTETDPDCSMGYWGVAMTYVHPLWEAPGKEGLIKGNAAIKKARSVGKNTEREWGYIAALEVFYKKKERLTHTARAEAYRKAMEGLYKRYPDDPEAAIFYALSLLGTVSSKDKSYKIQRRAGEILEGILIDQPNHPGAAHYIIHSYDYPELAHRAQQAAEIYAKIAPSVPHALHMPSHIFTRLGLWEESIQSNLDSSKAARGFAERNQQAEVSYDDLHALDYLMYAYLQSGQDQKALGILKEIQAIEGNLFSGNFASAYALAAIPARYSLEKQDWAQAATLSLNPGEFPWQGYPWAEANIVFSRAMGNARKGNVAVARENEEKLQALHAGAKKLGKNHWANQIEIQRLKAAAWIRLAEQKNEEALKLMKLAVSLENKIDKSPVTPGPIMPASEILGEMYLLLDEPGEALKAFEQNLEEAPNRFNGLYGAAKAAVQVKEYAKALVFYSKLVEVCRNGDFERKALQEAKAFLEKRKG